MLVEKFEIRERFQSRPSADHFYSNCLAFTARIFAILGDAIQSRSSRAFIDYFIDSQFEHTLAVYELTVGF